MITHAHLQIYTYASFIFTQTPTFVLSGKDRSYHSRNYAYTHWRTYTRTYPPSPLLWAHIAKTMKTVLIVIRVFSFFRPHVNDCHLVRVTNIYGHSDSSTLNLNRLKRKLWFLLLAFKRTRDDYFRHILANSCSLKGTMEIIEIKTLTDFFFFCISMMHLAQRIIIV